MMDYSWIDQINSEPLKPHRRIISALLALVLFTAYAFLVAGCTVVRYQDGDKSLTIADLRISGSAIDLDATLNQVGSLSVNREQGSQGEAVAEAAEVLSP